MQTDGRRHYSMNTFTKNHHLYWKYRKSDKSDLFTSLLKATVDRTSSFVTQCLKSSVRRRLLHVNWSRLPCAVMSVKASQTRSATLIVVSWSRKLAMSLHLIQWRRKRYGRFGGRHTNVKFGMAAPYQSAEIWAVDFQENH